MLASILDILVVFFLASTVALMQAIPLWLVLANLLLAAATLFGLDFLKVWFFQKSNLH
jgi:hypothetical protein